MARREREVERLESIQNYESEFVSLKTEQVDKLITSKILSDGVSNQERI
jgi:hypothetical protein